MLIQSKSLADSVNAYLSHEAGKREAAAIDAEADFKRKLDQDMRVSKQNECLAYKSWAHKTLRWTVGVAAAIVLYSLLVAIHEK